MVGHVSSRTHQILHHVATIYTALMKTQATVVWFTADNLCHDRTHDLSKNNLSFFRTPITTMTTSLPLAAVCCLLHKHFLSCMIHSSCSVFLHSTWHVMCVMSEGVRSTQYLHCPTQHVRFLQDHIRTRQMFVCILHSDHKQLRTYSWHCYHIILISQYCNFILISILYILES